MRSTNKGIVAVAKSYVYRSSSPSPSRKLSSPLIAKVLLIAGISLLTYSGSLLADDAIYDNFVAYGGGYNGDGYDIGTLDFNDFSSFGDNSAQNQVDAKNLDQVNVTAHAGPDEQFNFPFDFGNGNSFAEPGQISKNIAQTTNPKKDTKNPCPGGDPVTIGSGAKIEAVTEFALPGEMGLTFARYYNSQFFNGNGTAALGTWTTSVDYHLFYTTCTNAVGGANPCAPIRFSQPDGSQLYFTQTPDPNTNINNSSFQLTGPFVETDGNRNPNGGLATLSYNSNGTYTLHNEDSRVITFNASGVVLSINDVSGIGWTITHPNSTDTVVTHTSGQAYTIHNALPAWGKGTGTVTVTDPAGDVYQYQSEVTLASAGAFSSIGLISSATTPGTGATTTTYKYSNPSLPVVNPSALYVDELSEVDYNGVPHDLTSYDSVGRAIQTMDADGTEKTTFAYGSTSTGPTTTVTNALGHTVVYQYNNNVQVVSTTGNASASCPAYFSSRQYDANGNLSSVTDNNGNTNHMTYSASGQLTQMVEAVGSAVQRTTDYVWDPTPGADRLLSVTVEGLSKKTYAYNAQGRRASVTTTNLTSTGVPNQTHTTTFAYTLSSNGMVTSKTVTPPNPSNIVTYAYDANGNVTSKTNGLGQATLYSNYSALGKPQAVTQPNGYGAFISYDARGRLTGTVTSHAGSAVYSAEAYDPNSGLVSDIYKPDQEHIHNSYDADFKLTSSTWTGLSGAVITTANTYNALGNVTGITKTLQGSTTPPVSKYWDYDELGRVIAIRGNNGQKISRTYDLNGNVATATDAAGHLTKFTYDALNRLTSVTNANGGVTTSTYGLGDHATKITDFRNLVTSYAYDGFGQLWTLTSPDTGNTNYSYNGYGQLASMTPNNGVARTYAYDAINRVTSISAGGETHTYTYDNCTNGIGQLCADGTPNTSSSYTYTPEGWEAQKTVNTILGPSVETYSYDYMGRLTQIGNVNSNINLGYTWTDDQVSSVTATIAGTTQTVASNIAYDVSRNSTGWTYGNGIGRSQTYDSDGRITGVSSSTTSSPVQAMGYSYNNVNELTNLVNTANPSASQNFTYNPIDRLTGMTGSAPLTLTYDPNGNRASQTGVANGALNVDTASNRILSRGGHTYAYDANGSRITDAVSGSTLNYTYDGFGRMRTASRNNAVTICETNGTCPTYSAGNMTYVVDAEGRREAKTDPNGETVWYYYLPSGQLNGELSSTRGYNYYVYLDGQPIGVIHKPVANNVYTLYFVHADQMGRPEVITDSAQNKAWTAVNYAFDSAPLSTGAVTGIDIGLPGQVIDAETGNWSNGYRDYDSSNGRYLESDPIGLLGGTNTYAYVGDNPLMYIDPLGLEWQASVGIGVTGAFLFGGGGGSVNIGITSNGSFFFQAEGHGEVGAGAYLGAGLQGGISHSKCDSSPGWSQSTTGIAEADAGYGPSAGGSVTFNGQDAGASTGLGRFGVGGGVWAGAGASHAYTYTTPSVSQMWNSLTH